MKTRKPKIEDDDQSITIGYIQDGHTFEKKFATSEEAAAFLDALFGQWMKSARMSPMAR